MWPEVVWGSCYGEWGGGSELNAAITDELSFPVMTARSSIVHQCMQCDIVAMYTVRGSVLCAYQKRPRTWCDVLRGQKKTIASKCRKPFLLQCCNPA